MNIVVDLADFAVSDKADATLVTHALGSCIGVAIWDPEVKVAGLLHYMLPESSASPERAASSPAMFCDTGLPLLFRAAYERGAGKERLIVRIAGGSQLVEDEQSNMGRRNYVALRRILWKNGISIDAEDVGGSESRTLSIEVGTGRTIVKTRSEQIVLEAPCCASESESP
jgi:chemotaxis protein CheD